jgi:nucleotide-binding universal stress UspA family protein
VAEILATADEHDVDLIAMATHGHSGLRHATVGSFALEVVAGSRRPVLLVRSRRPPKNRA